MINWLHRMLHDPRRGWDPVPKEYADSYAAQVAAVESSLVERICRSAGGLEGKRVADVGSGPGQYGAEFARRGAEVTCFDISSRYLDIARARFAGAGLDAEFVLTYMDDVGKLAPERFDVIFNNVCWYYCVEDCRFARSLMRAVKEGGLVLVRVQNAGSHADPSLSRRMLYWLDKRLHWKIGHLFPPRGRVESVFKKVGGCDVSVDYTDPNLDVVVVRKGRGVRS